MRLVWAQGRVCVGSLTLALSDQALGCGDMPALRVSAHRVGAHAGHQSRSHIWGGQDRPPPWGPPAVGPRGFSAALSLLRGPLGAGVMLARAPENLGPG